MTPNATRSTNHLDSLITDNKLPRLIKGNPMQTMIQSCPYCKEPCPVRRESLTTSNILKELARSILPRNVNCWSCKKNFDVVYIGAKVEEIESLKKDCSIQFQAAPLVQELHTLLQENAFVDEDLEPLLEVFASVKAGVAHLKELLDLSFAHEGIKGQPWKIETDEGSVHWRRIETHKQPTA